VDHVKLLVVSAHFPPNFVSGGTLVPLRSALELARRGHDVRVFAGWIGPARRGGDAFDDVAVGRDDGDVEAVPVHWFTTNDAIDWGSRLNFDNPAAQAEFAEVVRAFEPDIVHFHSMQGLGAGLLVEAARCRIPFVVTAHDFWWWCGRQFLCDRDYHPCCPVVVAGVCSCALDRTWLDERTRWTTSALGLAARVIAVSESSAAVLRANGVPPDQLVVIDNPVEGVSKGAAANRSAEAPDHRPTAEHHRDVRFVFAGGADPMKGLRVLLKALRSLGSKPGWTVDLYGVDQPVDPDEEPLPACVRTHAPFAPDMLAAVLSDADVLLIPSVMQETYSILTREALAMGVAVLTTTCLGPEEVVTDRVNGLVVPQDDPGALAAAMTELIEDRALLARLRAGAHGVRITSVEAHCDRLETLYAATLETRQTTEGATQEAAGGTTRKRDDEAQDLSALASHGQRRVVGRVLFVVGIDGAPLRYRAHLPAEALGLLGVHADVRHYRHPDVVELARSADAVVVYRVPATSQVQRFIADVRGRGTPVLFDVDDLIFDPDLEPEIPALQILSGAARDLWMQGVRRYRTTMEMCDGFIGSTEPLCEHATAVTGLPSFRFSNGVGLVMSRLADDALRQAPVPRPLRVGYLSGTDTHDRDWATVEEAVVTTLAQFDEAELWLVGTLSPGAASRRLGNRLVQVPFQPWSALPKLLRTLDVNLAPLEPASRFNDAKSAIKWLEAGLSATPTIASPTHPFQEVVEHGVNGMLASGPDEWARCLATLLADDVLRRRLGQRARRDALLGFGPWTQGRRYLEILQSAELRDRRASTWEPVLADEPYEPIALEPYGAPEPTRSPVPSSTPRMRLGTLARRGVGAVRRHGLMKTSALVLERVRQRARQP
jgi:glycosyltransferase involved in cell wall biosynthesis